MIYTGGEGRLRGYSIAKQVRHFATRLKRRNCGAEIGQQTFEEFFNERADDRLQLVGRVGCPRGVDHIHVPAHGDGAAKPLHSKRPQG